MDQRDLHGNIVKDPKPKLVEEHVRGHPDWIYPDGWLEDNEDLSNEEIDFYKQELWGDMTPFTECKACDEHVVNIVRNYDEYSLQGGGYSEKVEGFVCFPCKESDETYQNTVIIFKPEEHTAVKWLVGDYFDEGREYDGYLDVSELEELRAHDFEYRDGGKSPIQFRYIKTDGWRGYHEPAIPEGWIELHGDSILAWSEDEQQLKDFDTDIKRFLWEMGVEFAMGIGRSSNVFSNTYTVLANISQEGFDDIIDLMKIVTKVSQLKTEHRDRERFIRTCITGSSEKTEHADKMVKAYDMLEDGMTLEDIVKELI